MKFIQANLEEILSHFEQLEEHTKPLWGSMTTIEMTEHLTDSLKASQGKLNLTILTPQKDLEGYRAFLMSNKAIPKNSVSPYKKEAQNRNENLEFALDELAEEWIAFEEFFEENPDKTTVHPYFGMLDYKTWLHFHAKHFTHHLTQFGIEI